MKIDTENRTIAIESDGEDFEKQVDGVRPNAVIFVSDLEWSMLRALQGAIEEGKEAVTLVLQCIHINGDTEVRRQVMDISFIEQLGHILAVISWRHVSLEGEE
jgi:hypothetical protein